MDNRMHCEDYSDVFGALVFSLDAVPASLCVFMQLYTSA